MYKSPKNVTKNFIAILCLLKILKDLIRQQRASVYCDCFFFLFFVYFRAKIPLCGGSLSVQLTSTE